MIGTTSVDRYGDPSNWPAVVDSHAVPRIGRSAWCTKSSSEPARRSVVRRLLDDGPDRA
jgi:hypothetical protein